MPPESSRMRFRCGTCDREIVVSYLRTGEVAKCRACGAENVVPSEQGRRATSLSEQSVEGRLKAMRRADGSEGVGNETPKDDQLAHLLHASPLAAIKQLARDPDGPALFLAAGAQDRWVQCALSSSDPVIMGFIGNYEGLLRETAISAGRNVRSSLVAATVSTVEMLVCLALLFGIQPSSQVVMRAFAAGVCAGVMGAIAGAAAGVSYRLKAARARHLSSRLAALRTGDSERRSTEPDARQN